MEPINYNKEFIEITQLSYPEKIEHPIGFLEITNQYYKEVIISRLYQYFLTQKNNSKIAELFIQTLLELVQSSLIFTEYICEAEVSTQDGKRIDLLITSETENAAIIIENKIYHHLNNDLEKYWNHSNYKNKIGIILSLKPCPPEDKYKDTFCNVTHQQWMSAIVAKGLPTGLDTKQYIYLNDFINTLSNLSKTMEMNNQVRFFFEHTEPIMKALQISDEARNFVTTQIELAAQNLGQSLWGKSDTYRCIYKNGYNQKIFYTIVFDTLLGIEKCLTIIIELHGKEAVRKEEFKNLIPANINFDEGKGKGTGWVHLVARTYYPTIVELGKLGEFIAEKIEMDFEPTMNTIISYINGQISSN